MNPGINTIPFSGFRLLVVSASFLFLLYFGLFLNIITLYGDGALQKTPEIVKLLVGISALALIVGAIYYDLEGGTDNSVRRFVAFPGGLLSGIGLIMYSRTVRSFSVKVAGNFILAAVCMIFYALFTGIIPSDFIVPVIDLQIILLRGGSAFLIMFFTIRGLAVFSLEQRELINERLRRFSQSEKLTSMGILAAGIAHEINNPLANVSLNVEMLKDQIGDDDKVRKRLDAIERNTARASRIARELLHFSREKESAQVDVDINQIINSSIKLLKNQRLSPIILLKLQDVPRIRAIPWKLEEVFINVLLNSMDACTETDVIEVQSFSSDDQVVVTISDSGTGISEENLSRVFDPFFTTKEIGKGTGLGLSVCYNIIENHGGEISISTVQPRGTRVIMTLPVNPDDQ